MNPLFHKQVLIPIAGIDPGLSGGIAIIDENKLVVCVPMPLTAERELDIQKIRQILGPYPKCTIVIEQQIPFRGQGISSTFKTAKNYGYLLGIFRTLDIPVKIVSAVRWKNVVMGKDRRKDVDKKIISLEFAKKIFPETNFLATARSTKDHDGMFESALIAYYGYVSHQK